MKHIKIVHQNLIMHQDFHFFLLTSVIRSVIPFRDSCNFFKDSFKNISIVISEMTPKILLIISQISDWGNYPIFSILLFQGFLNIFLQGFLQNLLQKFISELFLVLLNEYLQRFFFKNSLQRFIYWFLRRLLQ